jgi:hypothetical protein
MKTIKPKKSKKTYKERNKRKRARENDKKSLNLSVRADVKYFIFDDLTQKYVAFMNNFLQSYKLVNHKNEAFVGDGWAVKHFMNCYKSKGAFRPIRAE